MVAVGCLVESASMCPRVAERNRAGLGEKVERGFIKELRGPCPHQEEGFPGNWLCGGRKGSCNYVEERQRTI